MKTPFTHFAIIALLFLSTDAFAQAEESSADQSAVEQPPSDEPAEGTDVEAGDGVADDAPDEGSSSEQGESPTSEQRADWESQLEVVAEEACARVYQCATENVPRMVRRTIKREKVCEAYQDESLTGPAATVSQECFSASLDYLRCVRSSSCDDLAGSGARACVDQAERAERACRD